MSHPNQRESRSSATAAQEEIPAKLTLTCPMCDSKVRITAKGYFCTNTSCEFRLWPTMHHYSEVLKITEDKAKRLLSGKRRAVFRLKKKDGTGTYDVYLKIKLNTVNGKTYVNFECDGYPKR